MSKTALAHILDRWTGSRECDHDSSYLTRFLTERDEDAFASLVRLHGSLVYGTCQRILGNRADSDDAFQAVFFVLARRAHTLKLDRGIGPWLHGVAVRVAKRLRGQSFQRRLREMAGARTERVEAAEANHDFWVVLDEELARLSHPLREVLLLCDLNGHSHAQAARSLGLAKGTVTKRLAKAHEELATRLRRRGITLGVGALSSLFATQAVAAVPSSLLQETAKQATAFATGGGAGSLTVRTLAEGFMRSLEVGAVKKWLTLGLFTMLLVGGGFMFAGGPREPRDREAEQLRGGVKPDTGKASTMWKESYTVEYPGCLPVSVAFSADGTTLLTGDTNGEVMALIFTHDDPRWRWKARVGGSHAVAAFSADQKKVYATTQDGVRVLDAARGRQEALVEVKDSNPSALGVFPNRPIAENFLQSQIVFGTPRGYFVKTWADGKLTDTISTLETSTLAKGAKPADGTAVPLAVDPKGRSAIMTGPRDVTGQFTGVKGKNVLWAYVCGNYDQGSPGNRVMVGHVATVVSAAWAREGGTAVTGDSDGRVIIWDAKTMKEVRRMELGGRVLALAISDDGVKTAAYVRGKDGADLYLWETARSTRPGKSIHTQQADFGFEPCASLAFSPDGKKLAGCAGDRKWLQVIPRTHLNGKVHVWELSAEPRAQLPPKHVYTKALPQGSSSNFVVLDNNSILMPAGKEGAIDLRDIEDGSILFRLALGKFSIGGIKLSSDRKWMALEQHPPRNNLGIGVPATTFEVGVYESLRLHRTTIPSCSQLLDVASGGKLVAVVREKKVELWDVATTKLLKSAPFEHTRIDAARFSPDGKLLAISDRNDLVLWRWEENAHERIPLGRSVGSLTFSPDGKFLAEGPTPRENLRIRDVRTRKIVQTLSNGTKLSMNVPRMAYTQGGRVLVACDNNTLMKTITVPHRIHLWDTVSGSIAHQLAVPAGLPVDIDVSPNGRYLVAMVEDDSGRKLSVWRLDGAMPETDTVPGRPAASPR